MSDNCDNGSDTQIRCEEAQVMLEKLPPSDNLATEYPEPSNHNRCPESGKRKRKKKKYNKTWREAWLDFCTETSFHGLKQITEPQPYLLRRLCWLVLVLLGSALFLHQMISGIIYYRSYPVSVNVKINHNDSVTFPAVTICNQNSFRKTKAVELGWYDMLSEVFAGYKSIDWNTDLHQNLTRKVTLVEAYTKTAHSMDDMIIRCSWSGEKCTADDFVTRVTDEGVCYTFNSGRNQTAYKAYRTGTEGGLKLLLNIEQYEYMFGPSSGAGLKVLVHTHQNVPLVGEFGMAVPPGSHSFLGITLLRVENLPHPHGVCDDSHELQSFSHYTKENCMREVEQNHIHEQCDCLHISMSDTNQEDVETCSLLAYTECVKPAIGSLRKNMTRSDGICPIPCVMSSHELSNSLSDISDFDALNLLNSRLTAELQKKYTHATEVTQRVNPSIVRKDNEMVKNIQDTMIVLGSAFDDIVNNMQLVERSLKEMFQEIEDRTWFHHAKALYYVLFTAEHDFVRGWTILEERTLPYLSYNFYELIFSFSQAIDKLESTRGTANYVLSMAFWVNLESQFKERLDVAVRVIDNVTEVHQKYKNGQPLLTFKVTHNRRYDRSLLCPRLLQEIVDDGQHDQDTYYEEIVKYHGIIVQTIETFIKMGNNVSKGLSTDNDQILRNNKAFRSACVKYNYNLFLFKTRIVEAPVIIMKERIETFSRLNRTLVDAREAVLRAIGDISNPISSESFKQDIWKEFEIIAKNGNLYLNNASYTKYDIGTMLSSDKVNQKILDAARVISNLRLHGDDLNKKMAELKIALIQLWTNMFTEYTTESFYIKLAEDVVKFPDRSSFYSPYFAPLLEMEVDQIKKLQYISLKRKLNADIFDIDLNDRLGKIEETFDRLAHYTAVSSRLGTRDDAFFDAIYVYRDSMQDFLRQVNIDTTFYQNNFIAIDVYMRELSYEEIIQQPAYEMLNLLGDIGGSIGLFLGASAMTLAEVFDVIFLQIARKI